MKKYEPNPCLAATCVSHWRTCKNCMFGLFPVEEKEFCERQFQASLKVKRTNKWK